MSKTVTCLIAFFVTAFSTTFISAQSGNSVGLVSEAEARRNGLERIWFTQVALDPAKSRITNVAYFVSAVNIQTIYEVQYKDRKKRFTEKDVDRLGKELGKDGVKKAAEDFVESLKTQDLEGKIEKVLVPESTLYVTTDRGIVHAIDAETGQTRWASLVGDRKSPTECPGASEAYLAVINGTDLFLLNRANGQVIWKRRVKGVPGAGPAITTDYVVVPTFSGNVELYEIKETRKLPEIYKCNGRVLIQPTVTALSVAWPTDRGFLYVAQTTKKGLRFRLEARETIVCPASFAPPSNLYAASIDGYVYCLHQKSGSEIWVFSTGEAISNTPVPVGENLFIVTDKGSLFCVDPKSGQEKWTVSGYRRLLSASQDRLYCLGDTGRVVIVDAKTGGRISSLGTELLDLFYTNLQTDRIFLGSKSGVIECLRETNRDWPLVHAGVVEESAEKPADEAADETEAEPGKKKPSNAKTPKKKPGVGDEEPGAEPGAGKDPFGGDAGADPFGDKKPAMDGKGDEGEGKKDPGADPFGGGEAKEQPKPEAGGDPGADPFK